VLLNGLFKNEIKTSPLYWLFDQLLVRYSAFMTYLRKMGIHCTSISPTFILHDSLWFSYKESFV